MQPRSGRGGGAVDPCIHGLIAFPVLELFFDIRRYGHLSQTLQRLQEDALAVEPDQTVAPLHLSGNLTGQLFLGAEAHLCPGPQLLPRTHQAFPDVVPPVDEQQRLAGPAPLPTGVDAAAQQPGGQNTGVVHNQTVAGAQQLRKLIKMPVGPRAGLLVQDQQPGGVPLFQGRLGNQLRRQCKIKILCLQNIPFPGTPPILLSGCRQLPPLLTNVRHLHTHL